MGHCVHQDFISTYLRKGGAVLDDFPEFMLDEEQLRSDNRVMFGALKSIFRLGQAKRHIRVQDKSQDGMRAWAAIVQEFDMGGDKSVLIEKHETQVSLKFSRHYQGGITGFVRDYEDAFVELETLNVHYDDQRRMSLLLRNLLIPDDTEWMVAHCEDKYKHDFIEACRWLRSQDARRLFYNDNSSKRRAHRSSARTDHKNEHDSVTVDHLAFYISQLSMPSLPHDSLDSMRTVLLTRNDSHYIAPAIWSQLNPTSKQDILRAKLNLPWRNGGDNWETQRETTPKPKALSPSEQLDSSAPPSSFGKPLSKQYMPPATTAKANMAKLVDDEAAARGLEANSDNESDGDPETSSDFEQLKQAFLTQRRACISKTEPANDQYPTIQANLQLIDRMAGLARGNNDLYYAVTDNGADTTVMGDGWLILGDLATAPRANLVGFDKDAKKKGLPIVSGAIKVITSDGDTMILRVHQGVYNAGSRTTLISEFQVRDHGLVLDSICTRHRANVEGEKGTQSFWLSDNQCLLLKLKSGLMTFTFRKPSWEEMSTLEVIDITTEIPWHPVIHSDNPFALRSMNENTAFQAKRKDPPASKRGACGQELGYEEEDEEAAYTVLEGDTFHNAETHSAASGYYSDLFSSEIINPTEQKMFFFDPQDISEKGRFGKAFHLTINYDAFSTNREEPNIFVRDSVVDAMLDQFSVDELLGKNEAFDSYAYAIRAVHRFKEEELELIQPYLGYRPLEVIRQTLIHTTQLARPLFMPHCGVISIQDSVSSIAYDYRKPSPWTPCSQTAKA